MPHCGVEEKFVLDNVRVLYGTVRVEKFSQWCGHHRLFDGSFTRTAALPSDVCNQGATIRVVAPRDTTLNGRRRKRLSSRSQARQTVIKMPSRASKERLTSTEYKRQLTRAITVKSCSRSGKTAVRCLCEAKMRSDAEPCSLNGNTS